MDALLSQTLATFGDSNEWPPLGGIGLNSGLAARTAYLPSDLHQTTRLDWVWKLHSFDLVFRIPAAIARTLQIPDHGSRTFDN